MPETFKETTRLTSATLGRADSRRAVNVGVERGSTVLMESAEVLYDDDIKPTYGTDGLSTQNELIRLIRELEGAHESFLLPTGLAALTLPIFAFCKPATNPRRQFGLQAGCAVFSKPR